MYPDWAGSGGNWPAIDEVFDPKVVQQQSQFSCGAACGQMLLKDCGIMITQANIIDRTGVPMTAMDLASIMNALESASFSRWMGGPLSIPSATRKDLIETLCKTGSWIAVLWEAEAKIGHMVIVDRVDEHQLLLIRDPWASTRYQMRIEDFLNYWTDYGVYRRPCKF